MMARGLAARLHRDEDGATLVELAFVIAVFLLLFFALLDLGRLSWNWVTAQKATQMAARMAATLPAACPGVPQLNARVSGSRVRFGTSCDHASRPCQPVAAVCGGVAGQATVDEIWARIEPLLPAGATRANLRFSYASDPGMNFLGGPFVPVVTVELQNLDFDFVSPLAGLARLAGATATDEQAARERDGIPFPSMSVSLPGEDLALGGAG